MVRSAIGIAVAALVMIAAVDFRAQAADKAVARGKYLVTAMACSDCHTDGALIGKPDMSRYLGGSTIGFLIPGLGYFYGPNLTSDAETGLGGWSTKQVAAALTTGVRPATAARPSPPWPERVGRSAGAQPWAPASGAAHGEGGGTTAM